MQIILANIFPVARIPEEQRILDSSGLIPIVSSQGYVYDVYVALRSTS